MTDTPRLLLCDCGGSAPLDPARAEAAFGPGARCHTALCRAQIGAAEAAGGDTVIACAQEQDVFADAAPDAQCIDIRDRALWSEEGDKALPKAAALIAEGRLATPPVPARTVVSEGLCLVYGPGAVAMEAAARLSQTLPVTLMLTETAGAMPPRIAAFPILRGRLRQVSGALGGFEIIADGVAEAEPMGRGDLRFGAARDGGRSACDIILDLSGNPAPITAPHKREGYLRADPRDPAAVARALFDAAQMAGEFEKPLYVRFEADLCAHSRARQSGCTRCLDVCPTGAITAAAGADHVTIDPDICAGCGACAAVCPSGAASYDYPPFGHDLLRLRTLAEAYGEAGGEAPRLLIHDAEYGTEAIALAARYGRGLPADVIPFGVYDVEGAGHALMVSALASGFADVAVLASPKTDRAALDAQAALARAIAGEERITLIDAPDPDALSEALYGAAEPQAPAAPAMILGQPREAVRLSAAALGAEAPIALPAGAPYGAVLVDTDACTLCLSCVSLCPPGALTDNPDKPELRFQEAACLQCGICASACPETAITLEPRLDPTPAALSTQTLHAEEPFECIECGAPFGVKSTIERIVDKLGGNHWMFTGSDNTRLIQMCSDCRVKAQFAQGNAPFAMGERPRMRTTEDDLREREVGKGEA